MPPAAALLLCALSVAAAETTHRAEMLMVDGTSRDGYVVEGGGNTTPRWQFELAGGTLPAHAPAATDRVRADFAYAPRTPAVIVVTHVIVPRATGDIDAWVRNANASARRVLGEVTALSRSATHMVLGRTIVFTPPRWVEANCELLSVPYLAAATVARSGASHEWVTTTVPWDWGPSCDWPYAGIAYVQGRLSWTRARMSDLASRHGHVMFHELGHNFGLHHAWGIDGEYGDDTCSMGLGRFLNHGNTLNGAMLAILGWANVTDGSAHGSLALGCLGAHNAVVQLDDATVLSFRCATGHDRQVDAMFQGMLYAHRASTDENATHLLYAGRGPYYHRQTNTDVLVRATDAQGSVTVVLVRGRGNGGVVLLGGAIVIVALGVASAQRVPRRARDGSARRSREQRARDGT